MVKKILTLLVLPVLIGLIVYQLQEIRYAVKTNTAETCPTPQLQNKANETKTCDIEKDLPVVVLSPSGLFSAQEKEEIRAKIVEPFFDYENADSIDFIVMIINRVQFPEEVGHKYTIDAISRKGVHHGWIAGENDTIEWWAPTCMFECQYPEGYAEKYPEVVVINK